MRCIFSKIPRLRAPKYQMITRIIISEEGEKFIEKKALSEQSFSYIRRIIDTYPIYKQSIVTSKVFIPDIIKDTQDNVRFSYIEGENLDNKLCSFLLKKDHISFAEAIKNYYFFLTSSFDCLDNFENSEGFLNLFGKNIKIDNMKTLRSYRVSNLDLNFDNIIFDESSGDYVIYDLDWIFNFSLPISYIFWRALFTFNIRHYELFSKEKLHQILKDYQITEPQIQIFEKMEEAFDNAVHNKHTKYLEHYLKKIIKPPKAKKHNPVTSEEMNKDRNSKLHKLFRSLFIKKKSLFKTQFLNKKIANEILSFQRKPLISILISTYNINVEFIISTINSIEKQWYENWELCIADNASTSINSLDYLKRISSNPKIKVKFLKQNAAIAKAYNEALAMATGEFIALVDHDGELTADALYEVVKAVNMLDANFIYSDEDTRINSTFCEPRFKPDYSPDMLLSYNYISHLTVIKKSLVNIVDGFSIGLDGAQDYDLFLKVLEHTNKVFHIPKILYHSRYTSNQKTANTIRALASYASPEILAINNAIQRRRLSASVEAGYTPITYRIKYEIIDNPLVSIIIPFSDKHKLLDQCVTSILEKSTYKNFEIIGIDNNSKEENTFKTMQLLSGKDHRVSFYRYNIPFNYSEINNYAVKNYANGSHILLLNNDTKVIVADWIEALLEHSQRKEIGAVGGLLLYGNNKIQHAGLITGIGGTAGDFLKSLKSHKPDDFKRAYFIQNISAVTGACLMVKKSYYIEVGGLNSENLAIAYNDVDFCLRLREKGYLNVYTPYCSMYHYESLSRGYENTKEKQTRFKNEAIYLKSRHSEILKKDDPYYNDRFIINCISQD